MEIVIKLPGFESPTWFNEFNRSLLERSDMADVEVSEVLPPPGAFGASWTPRIKARIPTVAQLVTILSLLQPIYVSDVTTVPSIPPNSCVVSVSIGPTHVEVVVPCSDEHKLRLKEVIDGCDGKSPIEIIFQFLPKRGF